MVAQSGVRWLRLCSGRAFAPLRMTGVILVLPVLVLPVLILPVLILVVPVLVFVRVILPVAV